MLSRTFSLLRKMGALLLLAHALPPVVCHAATYYFSTAGNDAHSGADPSAPKQSLAAAVDLALPGNTLLFKRGDAWYQPSAGTAPLDLCGKSGTADHYIRIDSYGEGPKPIIASLTLLDDAGWQNIPGTTRWRHDVTGFSEAWRLYVDGVSKYKINTSNPDADENDVDQPYEWFMKASATGPGGTVYVDTGSADRGPENVEMHPVQAPSVLVMKDSHYISISSIDFRGGSEYHVIQVEAECSNIVFDRNIIQRANGSGLVVGNLHSGKAEYVARVRITNNLVDKVWSHSENDPNIRLSGDGIFLLHAVDTGLISGNTVRNWGHCGITLTSYRVGSHGVHNIVVEKNRVSAGESGYMHAVDVCGFEGLVTNNVIRRNLFSDYQATNHLQGNHNKYYSNIFVGVTLTAMPLHSKQPWGMDMVPWKDRFGSGLWMAAHNNIVANNTFVNTERYAIVIGDDEANPGIVGNNLIANNIIYSYGPAFSGEIGLNVMPEVSGDIPVLNNCFWDFDPSAPVARYKNADIEGNYTAAQLNAAFPGLCRGNVQLDPEFYDPAGRDFRLTRRSPEAVRSGGVDLSSIMGGDWVDFDGNAWDASNPSIGAFQFLSQ